MQLWVWQWFQSSVQVREKWKEAEEPLSQTSFILYRANSVTFAFYLFHTNETQFCWKKCWKMHRELTSMYTEKKTKRNFKPLTLAVLSTVQLNIHEMFHCLNADIACKVIKRKRFCFLGHRSKNTPIQKVSRILTANNNNNNKMLRIQSLFLFYFIYLIKNYLKEKTYCNAQS